MFSVGKLHQNFKVDHEEEKKKRIDAIFNAMIAEFGMSETWAEVKHDKEMRKEFLKRFPKPLKFIYQRDPI